MIFVGKNTGISKTHVSHIAYHFFLLREADRNPKKPMVDTKKGNRHYPLEFNEVIYFSSVTFT